MAKVSHAKQAVTTVTLFTDRRTVYNLTDFAADHPGGIDVILDCAGDDATEPFDYAGHSSDAARSMAKFQVGNLEGHVHKVPEPAAFYGSQSVQFRKNIAGGLVSAGQQISKASLGVIVLGGLAILYQGAQLPSLRFGQPATAELLSAALGDLASGFGGQKAFVVGPVVASLFYLASYGFLYRVLY